MPPEPTAELLAFYDRHLRADYVIHHPAFTMHREPGLTWFTGPGPGSGDNGVLYFKGDEAELRAVLDRLLPAFRARGAGLEWKLFAHDDPQGRLAQALRAAGFTPETEEVLYALATDRAEALAAPDWPVRPLHTRADMVWLTRVHDAVWGGDASAFTADLWDEAQAAPGSISFHAVMFGDEAAAVGWTRFHGPAAYLHGGATLPSHRGRGAYRALLKQRLRDAAARGVSHVFTDAMPMSAPILGKLGFQALTRTTPYLWAPKDSCHS